MFKQLLALALLLATCGGCQLGAVLLADPNPEVDAKFEELAESRVMVLTYAKLSALLKNPSLQMEVMQGVTKNLRKQLGKKTEVVEPTEVAAWLDENPDWQGIPLDQIGQQFDANFLVYVELEQFSIREPGSTILYRGRARSNVMVVETARGAKPVFRSQVDMVYPRDKVVSATEISHDRFKQQILAVYNDRVARLFHSYRVRRKAPKLEGE